MNIFQHIDSETISKNNLPQQLSFQIKRLIINSTGFTNKFTSDVNRLKELPCCIAFQKGNILWIDIRGNEIAEHEYLWTRIAVLMGAREAVFITRSEEDIPRSPDSEIFQVKDHVNLSGTNPLIGPNDDEWGPRFPDMADIYTTDAKWGFTETVAIYKGERESTPFLKIAAEVFSRISIVNGIVTGAITARHAGLGCVGFVLSPEANPKDFETLAEKLLH